MHLEQLTNGLVVATQKPPKPEPPPEHPVRQVIRDALAALATALEGFEQTTHGRGGPYTIHEVGRDLVQCYAHPSAYTISDLGQAIDGLIRESRVVT